MIALGFMVFAQDEGLYPDPPPADAAFVRVVHAAPNFEATSTLVGDKTFPELVFGEISDYYIVIQGDRKVAFGAELVASTLATEAELLGFSSFKTEDFATIEQETIDHEGDLLSFIPLGKFRHIGPKPDKLTKLQTTKRGDLGNGLGLFGNTSIPITLVGTSYSANPLWNFEGALKEALGADVLNVADEGEGPTVPMVNYLKSEAFLETPPELIIWEIPERFLPVHYYIE